jgi:hypothetical protein
MSVKKHFYRSLLLSEKNTDVFVASAIKNMLEFGTGNFTIEFWFNAQPRSGWITEPFVGLKSTFFDLIYDSSSTPVKRITMFINNFGGAPSISLYSTTVSAKVIPFVNPWNHVALVRHNGVIMFFVNGVCQQNTTSSYGAIDNTNYVLSANNSFEFLTFIKGYIYNFECIKSAKYYFVNGQANDNNFSPSIELPLDVSPYEFILTGRSFVINGGELVTSATILGKAATTSYIIFTTSVTVSDFVPDMKVVSTICFVAKTPVLTDTHGYVAIETLTDQHTLNGGKKILAITETFTPETHLSLIKAGTLGVGIPSIDTIMTHNHKVLYNGMLTEALYIPNSTSIEYNGQPLYNVVLEEYGTMTVNNMTVETLDPDNMVSKMFIIMKRVATVDEKAILINSYNQYIQSKYVQTGMNTRNELEIVKN